jgi:hypothetical protein
LYAYMHACMELNVCVCVYLEVWLRVWIVIFRMMYVCHVRMLCMYFVLCIHTDSSKAYVNCKLPMNKAYLHMQADVMQGNVTWFHFM